MAEKDNSRREPLFSDVPGDRARVRAILAQWGVEESSIRRLMREPPAAPAPVVEQFPAAREIPPRRAGN